MASPPVYKARNGGIIPLPPSTWTGTFSVSITRGYIDPNCSGILVLDKDIYELRIVENIMTIISRTCDDLEILVGHLNTILSSYATHLYLTRGNYGEELLDVIGYKLYAYTELGLFGSRALETPSRCLLGGILPTGYNMSVNMLNSECIFSCRPTLMTCNEIPMALLIEPARNYDMTPVNMIHDRDIEELASRFETFY
jgi:hypothetical protein